MARLRLLLLAAISLLPGPLKRWIYRIGFGARIDSSARIGFGAIVAFRELTLARGTRIGPFSLIRVHKLSLGPRANLGGRVDIDCHTFEMGSATTIAPGVKIRADHRDARSRFTMGAESWVLDACYINPARPITLGRNVGVGGGSYIFAHGLWLSRLDGYPVAFGPVTIGDDVWLPWDCFILPNVEIGSGAVIGARSLVTKSIPARVLAAGTPAKVLREQIAARPPLEERNAMLLEATNEFSDYHRVTLTVEEGADWTTCRINGVRLFDLARRAGVLPAPPDEANALCVVHDTFTRWRRVHPRVYSLASYQSCEYERIGALQRRWLGSLRLIGVRFYPVDEVVVEA